MKLTERTRHELNHKAARMVSLGAIADLGGVPRVHRAYATQIRERRELDISDRDIILEHRRFDRRMRKFSRSERKARRGWL